MTIASLGRLALRRINLWLLVIREAFTVLMPLTFFGLIALLLQYFPWSTYRDAMALVLGGAWPDLLEQLIRSTHGIFGLVLASVVSTLLMQRLSLSGTGDPDVSALVTGISALINFMLALPESASLADGFGHGGMLRGILVGLGTTEMLWCMTRRSGARVRDVPYGTDPVFHYAIQLTPAVIASGCIFFLIQRCSAVLPSASPDALSSVVVWAQLQQADATWLLSFLATLMNQVAWFFGVHGAKILDTYGATLFAPIGSPYDHALAWRPLFNHFVLMGGAGATLCLVIAIFLEVREGASRRIAKWSMVPAFFNINEAILYGLPIVLNVTYLVPFLCVPLLFVGLSVAAAETGLVHFLAIDIPWTTPPLWSGWLLTESWRGVALQVLEIGLGVAFYIPFVRKSEQARQRAQVEAVGAAITQIAGDCHKYGNFVIRQDAQGRIAKSLLGDLETALGRNDGALRLAYQPKHDKAGAIVGVEALVRWEHPLHGPISPTVLVALSENGRGIHQLGAWVLEQACACKARWSKAGYQGLTMAVNLSPLQLEDYQLTERLEKLLRQHGLQPSEIELEITESAAIPDSQAVERTLRRFVEIGVRLAMDDFGMGYSSLLYLRRFHVHTIKIDGSLTRDVLTSSTNADIIRTIVSLGQSQKVNVVAEYVETKAQRAVLAELGCDIFQGYFHSPALPESQCMAYFMRNMDGVPTTQASP